MEPPSLPAHSPQVIYVAAKAKQTVTHKKQDRTVGECLIVDMNGGQFFSPEFAMAKYLKKFDNVNLLTKIKVGEKSYILNLKDKDKFSFEITQEPLHGEIQFNEEEKNFEYIPEKSFEGRDQFTVKVTNGKFSVNVIYFASIEEGAGDMSRRVGTGQFCEDIPTKSPWIWKDASIIQYKILAKPPTPA